MSRTRKTRVGTIEFEAFAERVAASVLGLDLIETSINRTIKDLSGAFDPCWPQTEKLAWLFVANLGALDPTAREQEIGQVRDAIGSQQVASAAVPSLPEKGSGPKARFPNGLSAVGAAGIEPAILLWQRRGTAVDA